VRAGAAVIVSPGLAGYELHRASPDQATIYNMDMPYASPMCLGLALACPDQRVVAIEGDGSMLMALGVFTTVARYQPANLGIIVFDNGHYVTTGDGQVPTATTTGTDLAGMARAAGIARATTVDELGAFEASLFGPGPWVTVAKVDASDRTSYADRGGFAADVVEQAVLCQRELRRRRGAVDERWVPSP
jgi:thiamine pyrophosphate-dependent acetolactate synthase large subunit-like protein